MFNIISFGKRKRNLLKAIETTTIGSSLTTFKDSIQPGATIFLHCGGLLWGTGEVQGSYFFSDDIIWSDKLYPHRYKFVLTKFLKEPVPLNDGIINTRLRRDFGAGWAYKFLFTPRPIPSDVAKMIVQRIDAGKPAAGNFVEILESF